MASIILKREQRIKSLDGEDYENVTKRMRFLGFVPTNVEVLFDEQSQKAHYVFVYTRKRYKRLERLHNA